MVQSVIPLRRCQIVIFLPYFFGNLFPNSSPAKLMHTKRGPSPRLPSLNAILEFMLDRFVCIREAKYTLLGYESRRNGSPPLINNNNFVPYWPHEHDFYFGTKRIQTCYE
jgi:hypothetical protein